MNWSPADLQSIQAQAAAAIDKLETKMRNNFVCKCGHEDHEHRRDGQCRVPTCAKCYGWHREARDPATRHNIEEASNIGTPSIDAMAKKWKENRKP